jgi:hypothetical protein
VEKWVDAYHCAKGLRLREVGDKLTTIFHNNHGTFVDEDQRMQIKELEALKSELLLEEEEWWIKSTAIWIKSKDKNTNFFHNFAVRRKKKKTISGRLETRTKGRQDLLKV